MTITYLFFSLLLGMRHGIDSDHLAIINGINLNNHANDKSSSWSGFFFSLGHGLTVTLIGVLIILFKDGSQSYTKLFKYTEWIPIVILLFTGFYGIFTLLNNYKKNTHGNSQNKLIFFLTNTRYPAINLFLTGLFFALIFDTATQVAAWTLIDEGNSQSLYLTAILVGLFFTAGMMITDYINGMLFYRILSEKHTKFNLRMLLSLLVIVSNLAIGGIQLVGKIGYPIETTDELKLIWGLFIMSTTIFVVVSNFYYNNKQLYKS